MKLSILICSLEERKDLLNRLLDCLNKQKTDDVEIIVETDNGKLSIGDKRNLLLNKATGDYVCFIDDDDLVSDKYISLILKALENTPDCVGISGLWITHEPDRIINWSKKYAGFNRIKDTYFIGANHITPVKASIARTIGFKSRNIGEDQDYGLRIRKYLNTEEIIKEPIYYYYCNKETSAALKSFYKKGY